MFKSELFLDKFRMYKKKWNKDLKFSKRYKLDNFAKEVDKLSLL